MTRLLPLLVTAALTLSACAVAPPTVPAAPTTTQLAQTSPMAAAKKIWRPKPGLTWQIQYAGKLAATQANVVNLDGVETSKAQVTKLHAQGKKVICYFNAGGYENWRADRKKFPKSVLGKPLDGWPGERWLDIRKAKKLLPIMKKRMDQCKAKGFDAVDPDNMDGYQTATGFPLKSKHALTYLKALSKAAHQRGLAIGLKNATDLIGKAKGLVEFAVNEECLEYDECSAYLPLLKAGKAVFHVEYTGSIDDICKQVPAGFATVRKHPQLDAWEQHC
ncbi:MAG: endo alpha-1,4 polygalactosaminidase [Propionicimonas sp.]|uniref:endo alpha-1,4 polygalactosaminidase n=1 Tax=Propionicimonas sp. TaxID=1955623 RepID=UPI001D6931D2|nr:endo alpha-1,4 polygalactosaminidase [Propionicimonas sp.]MBU4188171.1 endo alpha-1,4 polygalactosaminidase [Actinomycetota bacterium]MBU4206597.1 endo alpha-1,4 polygalactosaminidase [Actinomycetota bacterium]MBU4250330.1 endo alpha-1,4 polygalactosaminidase [Actinomycetota bacterium]MBU4365136.1 endo alpha-1,4 polygalactosaminidase [Actinomycetota bacterium]MBU4408774.1 endo alpha-1,4 polygalactosaminidase [Actinomycetota bacterium]